MKKLLGIIAITLLISGCSKKEISNKEIEELTDKFTYTTGKCLVDDCLIIFTNFKRGDLVEILSEDDTYYYIDNNGIELAVEKEYIKTSDNEFKSYTAYTYAGAILVDNIFDQNKIETYSLNDEIEVIDEFKKWAIVKIDDGYGYILLSKISKNKIVIKKEEPVVTPQYTPDYSYDYGGGSSSGGSSGGGSAPAPSEPPVTPSVDGEDMELMSYHFGYSYIKLLDSEEFKSYIIVDGVIAYLGKLNRNDVVKVLNSDEGYSEILINGRKAKIENKYVRLDSEVDFLTFDLYTRKYAKIYSNFKLSDEIKTCGLNDELKVLDEIDNIYVVEIDNGYGYIAKSQTSKSKIVEYVAPKVDPVPVEPSYDYSGGGSSGGGSSGGGSSSGGSSAPAPSESSEEWTEPVL